MTRRTVLPTTPVLLRRRPGALLFTGGHSDYHRPTDTADKIDAAGMARVAAVGARVVERLASEARPVYAQVARPTRRQQSTGAPTSALLGVVAMPRAGHDGLRLASVMPGTGAERAGLREGDVIVRVAGVAVDGLEELRTVIRDRKPGDTVAVALPPSRRASRSVGDPRRPYRLGCPRG